MLNAIKALYNKLLVVLLSFTAILSSGAVADGWPSWNHETAFVPFFYSTESMGFTLGAAGLIKGVGQDQAGLLGVGLRSEKGSYITYLSGVNYQFGDNLLVGADGYNAKYVDFDYFLGEQGNNSSEQSSATRTDGRESNYRLSLRYILPIGHAESLGAQAALHNSRDISGKTPFDSGVSTIELQPFYSSRELEVNYNEAEETWGMALKLDWDNRNDVRNPTEGSRTSLDVTYSPEFKQDSEWVKLEFENNLYWDLGNLKDVFDKQVLAFSFYTADTPNWSDCGNDDCHRPPEYEQVALGGLYRLRSYGSNRFHGRSAIHYSAEYRVMPEWQPLGDWPVFNFYDVPWWQWVAFVDVGRVADEYNLKTLHTDMKWSAGGAIRFQVEGIVVRTELAWGKEDSAFWVMVNQPF
ncbi:BamA/TamA family outer membrane protein [Vibrio hannami]|uniref:BamA/TamA family outer membrane protein n=1 Tax=Vibrio hannami TaxID=2717094 RepID=UPI002410835F|nr:BamA/TamA family outer membrane protein [Vibrio hannami]MDG3084715.1 BamA/TamA family outer membrane protein [Vibrio hannami]